MKITKLKRILSLLITLGFVGVLLTSCEKENIGEEVYLETAKIDNTVLNSESLKTSDELIESAGIKVEANQINERSGSCHNLYVYPAQLAWHGCYVTWFYNPTQANKDKMDNAYCFYIYMFNYCYGTNYDC